MSGKVFTTASHVIQENVLLDSEGHIKITDFGLAKLNMAEGERTNSFIGTMEYMAPEIITGKGHGKDVDWWSVGILLFEMLTGMPPFNAKSRNQLQKQIIAGKLKYPRKFHCFKTQALCVQAFAASAEIRHLLLSTV